MHENYLQISAVAFKKDHFFLQQYSVHWLACVAGGISVGVLFGRPSRGKSIWDLPGHKNPASYAGYRLTTVTPSWVEVLRNGSAIKLGILLPPGFSTLTIFIYLFQGSYINFAAHLEPCKLL